MQSRRGNYSLATLIQEAIAALAKLDAKALTRLQPEIEALEEVPFPPEEDLAAAMLVHQVLGKLLRETEKNLRMLRATSACCDPVPGPYDPHFGSSCIEARG